MKLFIISITLFIAVGCNWNPHKLSNKAVREEGRLYSPDSTKFILTYDLDVGARGSSQYQCVLNSSQENNTLNNYFIPWELSGLNWIDNNRIEFILDTNAALVYGSTYTEIDLNKDTILINGVLFIEKDLN